MAVKKTYKAKQDLPGCQKGRTIVKDGDKYTYTDDNSICVYKCADEPKFFVEVKPPKHVVGTVIILKEPATVACCNVEGEKTRQQFTLPAYTEFKITGEKMPNSDKRNIHVIVEFNKRHYLVSETLIKKPDFYFYLSSKGSIHRAWTGKDEKADRFRKSIGNCHVNQTDARTYVSVLKEKLHLNR